METNSVCMSTCTDAADITSQSNFANVLQCNVNVSNVNVTNVSKISADPKPSSLGNLYSTRKKQVNSTTLAKRWKDQENAMVEHQNISVVRDSTAKGPLMETNSVCMSTCTDAADITSQSNFANVLQ